MWLFCIELLMQLIEANQASSLQWNVHDIGYDRQPAQPHDDSFFHPLDCEPTLQMGYVCHFLPLISMLFQKDSLPKRNYHHISIKHIHSVS